MKTTARVQSEQPDLSQMSLADLVKFKPRSIGIQYGIAVSTFKKTNHRLLKGVLAYERPVDDSFVGVSIDSDKDVHGLGVVIKTYVRNDNAIQKLDPFYESSNKNAIDYLSFCCRDFMVGSELKDIVSSFKFLNTAEARVAYDKESLRGIKLSRFMQMKPASFEVEDRGIRKTLVKTKHKLFKGALAYEFKLADSYVGIMMRVDTNASYDSIKSIEFKKYVRDDLTLKIISKTYRELYVETMDSLESVCRDFLSLNFMRHILLAFGDTSVMDEIVASYGFAIARVRLEDDGSLTNIIENNIETFNIGPLRFKQTHKRGKEVSYFASYKLINFYITHYERNDGKVSVNATMRSDKGVTGYARIRDRAERELAKFNFRFDPTDRMQDLHEKINSTALEASNSELVGMLKSSSDRVKDLKKSVAHYPQTVLMNGIEMSRVTMTRDYGQGHMQAKDIDTKYNVIVRAIYALKYQSPARDEAGNRLYQFQLHIDTKNGEILIGYKSPKSKIFTAVEGRIRRMSSTTPIDLRSIGMRMAKFLLPYMKKRNVTNLDQPEFKIIK